MRDYSRHPMAERHNFWMMVLFAVLTVLLTLVAQRAAGTPL